MKGSISLVGMQVDIKMMASITYRGLYKDSNETEIELVTGDKTRFLQWQLVECIEEVKASVRKPRAAKKAKKGEAQSEPMSIEDQEYAELSE